MIAIATGMGVGMNALLSRSLGEKNAEEAGRAARNGAYLYALSWLLFVVLGLFFSRIFFAMQTDIPEILEGGTVYIRICTITSFGVFGQIFCERLLQSTGCAVLPMLTQGVGAVINIILDPIMTFGMNRILMAFTATATAVFGIYFKLQSFVFMPVFGLNNGMVPIVSYNFGAAREERVKRAIKLTVCTAICIMTVGTILFETRGDNGFGYDPVFYVPRIGKTFAEADGAEKNAISHRGKALEAFLIAWKEAGLC